MENTVSYVHTERIYTITNTGKDKKKLHLEAPFFANIKFDRLEHR